MTTLGVTYTDFTDETGSYIIMFGKKYYAEAALAEERKKEREACAEIADSCVLRGYMDYEIAAAIRARSKP